MKTISRALDSSIQALKGSLPHRDSIKVDLKIKNKIDKMVQPSYLSRNNNHKLLGCLQCP